MRIHVLSRLKFITLAFLFITSMDAFSCSAFLMKGKSYCVIGFNENWKSMPGLVITNKRGVVKKNLSWNSLVSEKQLIEPELKWKSKYGSVSFNLLGLDLPCYGINEKGLFVVELYLDKTFSLQNTSKPSMFWGQWIQYQLDNYATVNEVLENLKNTPVIDWWPTFQGSHFFIADKKGNTAAIELINGKFQVSAGKTMPVQVLCNKPYESDLKKMQKFKPFGGSEILDLESKSWNNRFSKAAYYLQNYNLEKNIEPVPYAWNILDSIRPGEWQVVADVKHNIVYFRSDKGKMIKSIDISKCDFSEKSIVKYIDINSYKQGDVTSKFSNLTIETNDEYVINGFPIGYENTEFYNSKGYIHLKNNLHNYALDKLK